MEFGKHIGKGVWAFADKALPALYAVAYIFLVVRVLSKEEFGSLVLIQTIFTLGTAFCMSLALQPMIKFVSETKETGPFIVASFVMSVLFYVLITFFFFFFQQSLLPLLDKSGETNLGTLINYLPLLFLTTLYRGLASSILQATYQVQRIFWIDASYFCSAILMLFLAQQVHFASTAKDVIIINIIAQAFSTVVALALTRNEMNVRLFFNKEAFVKMWNFGKWNFGAQTIYNVYAQMDVFFISYYIGIPGVAIYNAAKIFTRIFDMVAQVLQMFLIPFASKSFAIADNENLKATAEKSICFSMLILLPVFFLMFFFPEWLLELLYKDKYAEGYNVVRACSFLALLIPWNGVVSSYLIGLGKVKQGFYFGFILLFSSALFYFLLTPVLGIFGTSIGFVGALLLTSSVVFLYHQRFVTIKLKDVILRTKDIGKYVRKMFILN
ncbi:MAG: oligosaccharide flippase family protein [Ignavibacteriae bacterium]|nr:oligosaccharide flippase family protein [Ignavibacteriota bacterium]